MGRVSTEERTVYPKGSEFESILAKADIDLWNLRDYPNEFYNSVREFVEIQLPSMYQEKLRKKIDFDREFREMEERINKIKENARSGNPFVRDYALRHSVPEERQELARRVWHATLDVLTEEGFRFPMARGVPRRRMKA